MINVTADRFLGMQRFHYQLPVCPCYGQAKRLSSTWRGESGEEWSSAQGLESVLLSIQSLMSANPYENEPGFEKVSALGGV